MKANVPASILDWNAQKASPGKYASIVSLFDLATDIVFPAIKLGCSASGKFLWEIFDYLRRSCTMKALQGCPPTDRATR
jgi:hypothetical protein